MSARHSMGVGEWLRMAEQNAKALLYLLGVVIAGCGAVGTGIVFLIRWEIHQDTLPILEAVLWKIDRDGDTQDFLRYKARKDSLTRATEPRISAAGYPLFGSE